MLIPEPSNDQIEECEALLDTAQMFVEMCTYQMDSEDEEEAVYTSVGNCFTVMRKCRDMANELALKLEVRSQTYTVEVETRCVLDIVYLR